MCFLLIKFEEFHTSRLVQMALDSFQTSILNHKSVVWPIFVSFISILFNVNY